MTCIKALRYLKLKSCEALFYICLEQVFYYLKIHILIPNTKIYFKILYKWLCSFIKIVYKFTLMALIVLAKNGRE